MKRQISALVVAGLLGGAAGAIAQFPAARAVALVDPPGIDVAGVHGSVWNGRAERIRAPEAPPVAMRWDVSAWRLLLGRLAGHVEFDVAGGHGETRFALSREGNVRFADARFRGPAAGIARHLPVPLLIVEGDVTARFDDVSVRDGRPRRVVARMRWDSASVRQPLDVPLGAVTLSFVPVDEGVHEFVVDVRDGALTIDGGGRIDAAGNYDAELRVEVVGDAPSELIDLLDDLAVRDDGAYVIRDSGRLPW